MDDQMIITAVRKRIPAYRIWCEDTLEENGVKCLQYYDSISEEEYRRLIDMKLIDREGYITKTYPLGRIVIRPRSF